MNTLTDNYHQIQSKIALYCERYQRDPDLVQLIAVSKVHPAEKIIELAGLGQKDFGENYLQEALDKIELCRNQLLTELQWHFIGHIQSRKCKEIAQNFDWVHTIESAKVAEKLNNHRTTPLNVLIQVNIDGESTKSGTTPEQTLALATEISKMPNLQLRGLMVIPMPQETLERQRETFAHCRRIQEHLINQGLALDQLSMGMTGDLEAAIAEGATQVRIGTALFGSRPPKTKSA